MKYLFIGIIKLYRLTLSKVLPPCCRYYPSCSEYGLTAIRRFGAVKGGYLAFWRIFRCNPFGNCGYDPVPEKGFSYKGDRTMPDPDESRGNGGTARADAPRLAFHEGTKKKYTVVPAPKKGKETQ